ncbi:L-2-hydroxyglutarate oxidase [Rhodohalobacter sp. SW132]|uniref:L-2-hydroxyglutarate oxidase n=1 Tax=Rhodohalobacter sp. SW132 TaxID=2293433 RepID=UPI000E288115|nr:L-2-hydroxyglutarate oxidase [Rhodohalobacter sp. SW132]REL25047.1 L-2-hydroxyglutarate oxidase [Rhodohalobacter sp. SW132]
MKTHSDTDFIIIGAGIVGLSTAYKLSLKYPGSSILVLEKEADLAMHQTGRNSGVIHSGIYYKPGSYRARNCIDGRHQLVDFCKTNQVEFEICGKVIVATDEQELPRLKAIYERGLENEIEGIEMIGEKKLHQIEPYVNGISAIHVPCAGIVDFKGVCRALASEIEARGNRISFGQEVTGVFQTNGESRVDTKNGSFRCKRLINCAGLQSDLVAKSSGLNPDMQIVPFRGEYYELEPFAEHKVKGLIYPLPNPDFPFLGVHFTRMALGGVECGPNAVFAFNREGYNKTSFSFRDTIETVNFPGFWKLAGKHWLRGMDEYYRSFSKKAFLENLQKLIPSIGIDDIRPAPAGVRAMALQPDGEILDDFRFEKTKNQVHVLNAPSPAATAGLSIGDAIVDEISF